MNYYTIFIVRLHQKSSLTFPTAKQVFLPSCSNHLRLSMSTNVFHQFPALFPYPVQHVPSPPAGTLVSTLYAIFSHCSPAVTHCRNVSDQVVVTPIVTSFLSHCYQSYPRLCPTLLRPCSNHPSPLSSPPPLLHPVQSFYRTASIISLPGSKPQVSPIS